MFSMRKTCKSLNSLPPSLLSLIQQKELDFPDSLSGSASGVRLWRELSLSDPPVWEDRKLEAQTRVAE